MFHVMFLKEKAYHEVNGFTCGRRGRGRGEGV